MKRHTPTELHDTCDSHEWEKGEYMRVEDVIRAINRSGINRVSRVKVLASFGITDREAGSYQDAVEESLKAGES